MTLFSLLQLNGAEADDAWRDDIDGGIEEGEDVDCVVAGGESCFGESSEDGMGHLESLIEPRLLLFEKDEAEYEGHGGFFLCLFGLLPLLPPFWCCGLNRIGVSEMLFLESACFCADDCDAANEGDFVKACLAMRAF